MYRCIKKDEEDLKINRESEITSRQNQVFSMAIAVFTKYEGSAEDNELLKVLILPDVAISD